MNENFPYLSFDAETGHLVRNPDYKPFTIKPKNDSEKAKELADFLNDNHNNWQTLDEVLEQDMNELFYGKRVIKE